MLSDNVASEELHDDKFGQLMRNKTVHLLALFLVMYIGVEVTIGGINCSPMLLLNKNLNTCNSRMDRNILDARSRGWAFIWLRFNWVLWW